MRFDLLEMISKSTNVTNVIILTHNIDFVFVQTVVLSAFRRCGNPKITIFADRRCAAESFLRQKDVLTDLGERYRVVPIEMGSGFRFHPKAILLAGQESGSVFVGSGNLTYGGWRENGEVWIRFQSETDGSDPFLAFSRYLQEVLHRVLLPEAVTCEVEEAFDSSDKPWMSKDTSNTSILVGRTGSGPALLDKILTIVGPEPIVELFICSPYYDRDGIGLHQLVTRTNADRTTVLCQPHKTMLHQRAWSTIKTKAVLQNIDFSCSKSNERVSSTFVHAKFYGFQRSNSVVVLVGSANCSRAALTVSGNAGNAELLAVQELTRQAFNEEFLDELYSPPKPVELALEPPEDDVESTNPKLYILRASFEAGNLLVGYVPSYAKLKDCWVDSTNTSFALLEAGVLKVQCTSRPKSVSIRAWLDDEFLESEVMWIDQEQHLRASARSRSVADCIRRRVQPDTWSDNEWVEVLDVFWKHLSYVPLTQAKTSRMLGELDESSAKQKFTIDDVFTPEYRAPKLRKDWIHSGIDLELQVQSLQHLLLRWFGVETNEPEEGVKNEEKDEDSSDEVVDRPERLPAPKASNIGRKSRNVRRIVRLLDQIQTAMTNADFLSRRSPDLLTADVKVVSILLSVGLGRGWIDHERFFALTHAIWAALFFEREDSKVCSLEERASMTNDKDLFFENIQSPELSAALTGWYLFARSSGNSSPGAVRFTLAATLAREHLPWLWEGGNQESVLTELDLFLYNTTERGKDHEEFVRFAQNEWEQLEQRAAALRCLKESLRDMKHQELRRKIRVDEVSPGEVLWQGNAGFCIVLHRRFRSGDENVPVLKLQGAGGETLFSPGAIVPLRSLLDTDVIPLTRDFDRKPRKVLREFIRELSINMASKIDYT